MSAVAKQVQVKERPIIFSGSMVKAILEGRKTQTRRVVKHKIGPDMKFAHQDGGGNWIFWSGSVAPDMSEFTRKAYSNGEGIPCPYGKPGDRLWCCEKFRLFDSADECACYDMCQCSRYNGKPIYYAETLDNESKWKPSIFMPRWASRITLEITNIRVEGVQEISAADAKAEGVEPFLNRDATAWRAGFQVGWDEINAKRGYSWEFNPWVWVIEFRKL